jgi:hypothetical protein
MPLRDAWSLQLPPLNDFVLSPGFGGGLVLLAALFVLLGASRREARRLDRQLGQQDKHHQEVRADGQRREALERCWQRLVWLVNTASTQPVAPHSDEASLGLGPELTLAILEGLHREAKDLEDGTLTQAVAVYLQQYGLVLGQRIGSSLEGLDVTDGRHAEPAGSDGGSASKQPEMDKAIAATADTSAS